MHTQTQTHAYIHTHSKWKEKAMRQTKFGLDATLDDCHLYWTPFHQSYPQLVPPREVGVRTCGTGSVLPKGITSLHLCVCVLLLLLSTVPLCHFVCQLHTCGLPLSSSNYCPVWIPSSFLQRLKPRSCKYTLPSNPVLPALLLRLVSYVPRCPPADPCHLSDSFRLLLYSYLHFLKKKKA